MLALSRLLDDVLTEPLVPGGGPAHHLPPDAKESAGVPGTYGTVARELDRALLDVLDRAAAMERAVEADSAPITGDPEDAGAGGGVEHP